MKESERQELQKIYLQTRDEKILFKIKNESFKLCKIIIFKELRRTGLKQTMEQIDFISDDASMRFIEMYLKYPSWSCRSFPSRLRHEVLYQMYNRKKKLLDKTVSINNIEIESTDNFKKENTDFVIQDIICDTIYWRNVFLNCYKARSFKSFVLSLTQFVSKRWVLDHAARLKKLYKFTRR